MHLGKAMHQMSIEQMELPLEARGETPILPCSDEAESAVARNGSSGLDDPQLMERIIGGGNLRRALKRVQLNKGSPGVDGQTVKELAPYLREYWPAIREQLLTGRYQPSVVRRVELEKPGGGVRLLGIPTVLDRFIQQAVLQTLQPAIDPTFSESSHGFRPGRSAHGAIRQAQRYVQEDRHWVVDVDLAQFFDRVHHDMLMGLLAQRIADPRVLTLLRRYLEAGVMVNGVVRERHEGTPQGGPLSPLLANVLLDVVDRELERRGHAFVRYADDCNVYVESRRAADRVMESLIGLYAKVKLQINPAKSTVARADERTFLGFRFWRVVRGRIVKRGVSPKAIDQMKARVRELTSRSKGWSFREVATALRRYLLGWHAYFGLAETPSELAQVDGWIRRRLRALIIKQCRHGPKIFRVLRARGVAKRDAVGAAAHCRRWWAIAAHPALSTAFPTSYFDALGIPRLEPSRTSTL
ncbi:MAG: group II intron reverse transcriptase/maturase [Gemmatimonadaceae bacterium]